jgi:hypothetical protein
MTNMNRMIKVELFLCLLIKHYAMKAYGAVDIQIHIFLTSALAGGEWSASCPGEKDPGTNWMGGWVNTRASLDDVEKIPDPTGTQTLTPSVVQPITWVCNQKTA